jgi:hypothetical protein
MLKDLPNASSTGETALELSVLHGNHLLMGAKS